jgi:hypothetical protein
MKIHKNYNFVNMAKEAKKKAKKQNKRANGYDEKLAVKGSFLDIIKAAAKNADNKSAKK